MLWERLTATVAWALLDRCEAGLIEARQFRLLVYGGVVKSLPLEVVKRIVEKLTDTADVTDAEAALDIVQARRRTNLDELPELLGLLDRVLHHPAFLRGVEAKTGRDNMRDYHWTEGAKLLLEVAPERGLQLAVECIESFGGEGSVTDRYMSGTLEFLDRALARWPNELWQSIARRIGATIDTSTYKLFQWLRGRRNYGRSEAPTGFELLPPQLVIDWVACDPDTRAWRIAEYGPPVVSLPDEPTTLARLVLERYGDRKEVRQALHANVLSGVFSGPVSEHYQAKLDDAKARLCRETHDFIRLWLREEVERLTSMVQSEIEREESQE